MNSMKNITKFLINLTSVGSIVLIATLSASQFAVMGLPTPRIDGKAPTRPGGPRFIQPIEDMLPGDLPLATGTRGGCVKKDNKQKDLTPLLPENQIGRTVSEYPVFFFYLPETQAKVAEFVLQDQSGNQIYKQALTISNLSGVIGVSIPPNKNVSPLQVGKHYRWSVALICDPQDRSADVLETGIVRRVELSADIRSELEKADPRQKAVIYAQTGIWQDALGTLAAARLANPNDPDLAADWKILLDSVNLGEIAAEPIVPIDPQPIAPIDPQP